MKFRITLMLFLFVSVSFFQNIYAQDASVPDVSDRYVIPALSPLPPVETTPEIPVVAAFWEGAPAQMAAGESAIFTLCVTNLGSRELPPELMPEVPPGVILAALPLSAEERAGGAVLKMHLIPLEGDFNLPARGLQHENIRFEIPALHIRISGLAAKPIAAEAATEVVETASEEEAEEAADDGHSRKRKIFIGSLSFFFIQVVIISTIVCFVLIRKRRELWRHS